MSYNQKYRGRRIVLCPLWKSIKVYPKEIRCRDERTYALLKDFCEKTDVKVSIYKRRMRALDEAEAALIDYTLGEY